MNYGRTARRFGARKSYGRKSFGKRRFGGSRRFKAAGRFKGQAKKIHRMNFPPRGGFHL